jgi:hypothetical protein
VFLVMLPLFTKASFIRTTVLVWVMAWMIVVPLFHFHPETEHHHGDASHVHGSTIHTVLSSDIELEHSETEHDLSSSESTHLFLQGSAHAGQVNHPEIEFSVLTAQTDSPLPKPGITITALPAVQDIPPQRTVSSVSFDPRPPNATLFLSTALPLRAPPFRFS